jgi:uncharacterized protein YbjT (DUF2867 family)
MIERYDELVTVFGGDGFIGRYVCEFLLRSGVRVRVASRDPRNSYFIQPLGQVGQFGFVQADVTNADSVRRAVDGTSAVVNLVGVFGRKMEAVHVAGARNAAQAARDAGTRVLVHISAIGADPQSPSKYGRTKGEGELAVRKAFPKVTIVRPSLVFGPEDNLTNRLAAMARLGFLPVIAAARKFQPVYVRDLARAISKGALEPQVHGGKTYEIGGPQVLTMAELNRAIVELSGQDTEIVAVPDVFGTLLSRFGWLPGSPLTHDQWLMLQRDNVAAKDAPGLTAFGIEPTPLAAVASEWLDRFRTGGKFSSRRIHLTPVS